MSYYPSHFRRKVGLSTIVVFYYKPTQKLELLFPTRTYVGYLYDPASKSRVLTVEYAIPTDCIEEFLVLLDEVVSSQLASGYDYYIGSSSFRMFSPIHQVIDSNGYHDPEGFSTEIQEEIMSDYKSFTKENEDAAVHRYFKQNPLLVPVLNEYRFELKSSHSVWWTIKSKLGKGVWDYLPEIKKRTDGIGIRRIQETISKAQEYGITSQMRVVYLPIELGRVLTLYLILKVSNEHEQFEIVNFLLSLSIYINAYKLGDNKLLIKYLGGTEAIDVLLKELNDYEVERFFIFDFLNSGELVTTAHFNRPTYHKVFDPKDCSWIFDSNELLEELRFNTKQS
jgi:hypothetical protein